MKKTLSDYKHITKRAGMYCWENLTVFLLKFYFQMIFYEILLSNRKKK